MIISGGVNIYPQEIEDVLIVHPKVADVAVFGVPNEEIGEEVKAVVQLADGRGRTRPSIAAELIDFCREHLAALQVPPLRSTSSTSCRACRRASSTSGSCATSTGATRAPASCSAWGPAPKSGRT